MFFDHALRGDRLPPGSLCLTFDDGPGRTEDAPESDPDAPGPRTAELGRYLAGQGVPATFFAVGKFAEAFPEELAALRAQGHLVANHTYDHPSLPAYVARGGDVVGQLTRTEAAITSRAAGGPTFFRPPYGDWWLTGQARSNVSEALNRSDLAGRHVGPILWDIDAGDVGFWRDDRPADDCASAYLAAIEAAGRGVVLMHDSTADIDAIRPRNRALGLVRRLVPELRRRGFRFVRLDQVPQIAAAARVAFRVHLKREDGTFLVCPPSLTEVRFLQGDPGPGAIWGVVPQEGPRWALLAPNGLFLSASPDWELVGGAGEVGEREVFPTERIEPGRLALRPPNRAAPLTAIPIDPGRSEPGSGA